MFMNESCVLNSSLPTWGATKYLPVLVFFDFFRPAPGAPWLLDLRFEEGFVGLIGDEAALLEVGSGVGAVVGEEVDCGTGSVGVCDCRRALRAATALSITEDSSVDCCSCWQILQRSTRAPLTFFCLGSQPNVASSRHYARKKATFRLENVSSEKSREMHQPE